MLCIARLDIMPKGLVPPPPPAEARKKVNKFILFYVVIGTLSHAKIILELLLQNDKAKAFSVG